MLDTLGTFRVVLERDLVDDVYAGHRARMGKELSALETQGIVDPPGPRGGSRPAITCGS